MFNFNFFLLKSLCCRIRNLLCTRHWPRPPYDNYPYVPSNVSDMVYPQNNFGFAQNHNSKIISERQIVNCQNYWQIDNQISSKSLKFQIAFSHAIFQFFVHNVYFSISNLRLNTNLIRFPLDDYSDAHHLVWVNRIEVEHNILSTIIYFYDVEILLSNSRQNHESIHFLYRTRSTRGPRTFVPCSWSSSKGSTPRWDRQPLNAKPTLSWTRNFKKNIPTYRKSCQNYVFSSKFNFFFIRNSNISF